MRLRGFAVPAVVLAAVLFTLASLEQAMGLFVQTFSSNVAVVIEGPEPGRQAVRQGSLTVVKRASPTLVAAVETPTAAETPSATLGPPETPTIVSTEAPATLSPTWAPEATETATATPTLPTTPKATATGIPTATATLTSTPASSVTATPSPTPVCPPAGIDMRLAPIEGVVALSVKGEGAMTLSNLGKTALVGADLRFVDADGEPAGAGWRVVVEGWELAFDAATQAWELPELSARASLKLVVGMNDSNAAATQIDAAATGIAAVEQIVAAEVVVDCGSSPVVVMRQKLVLRAAAVKPAPVALDAVGGPPVPSTKELSGLDTR